MEAVIEQWGRANYPRLMENPSVVEELYRKKVLNQPSKSQAVMAYPLTRVKSLAELRVGTPVTLVVTKVDSRTQKTDICKTCNRRRCIETGHTNERLPFYIVSMTGADESGIGTFKRVGSDPYAIELVEGSEEFIVSGTYKRNEKYGDEFAMTAIVPVSKEQLSAWDALEDYASVHGGEGGMDELEFNKFIEGKEKLLQPFFERIFIDRSAGRVKW